ncbi:MAG TPA: transglycosylase SLT domain-containing protein [Dehalococcoidia bacterium]|nr:transglycosylase SLT domain-containing protein [Dehalococcoidia bacterium]
MSETATRLSAGRTLNNVRVVWPTKKEQRIRDRESALKLLHRMRRDIQIYEFERERDMRRRKLGAAGLAAALAITGLPTATVITSQAAGGSSGPAEQPLASVVEVLNEGSTAEQYSLPLPLGQESLTRQQPLVQPPLAVEFTQAVERMVAPEADPAIIETAPAEQPAVVEFVAPTITFNSERHVATEYVAPPPPPRNYAPSASYKGYVVDLIHRYFPASQADFAVRVAYCESSFNPNAVGDQGRARGIFQFWRATFLGTDVGATYGWDAAFDAEINVRAAAELVARGGWGPWTCARKV